MKRRAHPALRREAFYTEEEIGWFNPSGKSPHWYDPRQKCVACLIRGQDTADLFLMFNAASEAVSFAWRLRAAGPSWAFPP